MPSLFVIALARYLIMRLQIPVPFCDAYQPWLQQHRRESLDSWRRTPGLQNLDNAVKEKSNEGRPRDFSGSPWHVHEMSVIRYSFREITIPPIVVKFMILRLLSLRPSKLVGVLHLVSCLRSEYSWIHVLPSDL